MSGRSVLSWPLFYLLTLKYVMRLNFCSIWRVHLGGLPAGGGGGKIKEVMQLFSNGHVGIFLLNLAYFQETTTQCLSQWLIKTYLRNQRHQWDKKNFIKKNKKKTTSHVFFLVFPSVMFCSHVNKQKTSWEFRRSGFEGCTVARTEFPLTHAQKANKWSWLQGLHTETLSPASLTCCFR